MVSKEVEACLVINNLAIPLAIAVEDKAIDTHRRLLGHTDPLNESWLAAQRAQRRHQPAVPVAALPDVLSRRPVDVEMGGVKDVGDALDRLGAEAGVEVAISKAPLGGQVLVQDGVAVVRLLSLVRVAPVVEAVEAVAALQLQVEFEVEVWVTILLVDPPALLDDLGDLRAAERGRLLVRGLRFLAPVGGAGGAALAGPLCVLISGQDGRR
jgi:hypothetical protein